MVFSLYVFACISRQQNNLLQVWVIGLAGVGRAPQCASHAVCRHARSSSESCERFEPPALVDTAQFAIYLVAYEAFWM